MKKIEILIGSPRKKGNTNILAQELMKNINRDIFSAGITYLSDHEIKPCVDCRGCKKGELHCVVTDGMQGIYDRIENSEIIIFGTPIYWFSPTAQMKLLIDRLRPYYQNKLLSGKKGALILPAGTGAGDCDLTIEMFKRIFAALEIEYIGEVTAEAYDAGDVNEDGSAIESAKNLANAIN